MLSRHTRSLVPLGLPVLLLLAPLPLAAEVHPLFDLTAPAAGPFPSDQFTVPDPTQNTGLRVNLPKPDCQQRPSDCEDIDVINTLDGFNVQPRLSIPFNGAIDVYSITSETVFLVKLVCRHDDEECDEGPTLPRVGINQVMWDTFTTALHVESDSLLEQHTRYALIVTRGVRDASGHAVAAVPAFTYFRQTVHGVYKDALLDAVRAARKLGVAEEQIAVATVFTTQSVTAVLEKIRDDIKAASPAPVDFELGPLGSRTLFPLAEVTSITWSQQVRIAPPLNPVTSLLPDLRSIPGAVGHIAFGRFLARDYQVHPGDYIRPIGTRTGTPTSSGVNEIYFSLVLPSGTPPPDGWPVVISGHGGGASKEAILLNPVSTLIASLAQRGIATIAINGVGHGFGRLGSLTVNRSNGDSMTFPSGGRGFDQNGDGVIDAREGFQAAHPRTLIDDADGFRQTVADLMQLIRQIEAGVDVDGDSQPDLHRSRIYYVGHSLGGMYGAAFLAIEPSVRAGVLSASGGPPTTRTLTTGTAGDRAVIGKMLAARAPSLVNAPGVTHLDEIAVPLLPQYHENLPLRDGETFTVRLADGTSQFVQSPVTNTVIDAIGIQDHLERTEWVMQSASPVAYAPYLRQRPLAGMSPKRIIVQFAKGDQTVPNPATTAMVRAGGLRDETTFYRHDLASAEIPGLFKDPHGFMPVIRLFGAIARGAQEQIVVFFDSDGELMIHPEPSRFFEVPIAGPLPENLNFIR
jgi:pimeloyl-ACP methyl ester carboxylesterase